MTKHILKNDGKTLGNLLQKVARLEELTHIFSQHVTPNIISHCKITSVQNNCLIVLVDSANWATQLRFYIPELLPRLRQHHPFEHLKAICCKIRPSSEATTAKTTLKSRTLTPLSKKTSLIMLETASEIQDPTIKEILEKIARRGL